MEIMTSRHHFKHWVDENRLLRQLISEEVRCMAHQEEKSSRLNPLRATLAGCLGAFTAATEAMTGTHCRLMTRLCRRAACGEEKKETSKLVGMEPHDAYRDQGRHSQAAIICWIVIEHTRMKQGVCDERSTGRVAHQKQSETVRSGEFRHAGSHLKTISSLLADMMKIRLLGARLGAAKTVFAA